LICLLTFGNILAIFVNLRDFDFFSFYFPVQSELRVGAQDEVDRRVPGMLAEVTLHSIACILCLCVGFFEDVLLFFDLIERLELICLLLGLAATSEHANVIRIAPGIGKLSDTLLGREPLVEVVPLVMFIHEDCLLTVELDSMSSKYVHDQAFLKRVCLQLFCQIAVDLIDSLHV